jgi:glycosyltransferase involved in cell wall biosynthesis
MDNVIKGLRILHVSTVAEVLVHFKLPLLEGLSQEGAIQGIYCSGEQGYGIKDDSCGQVSHVRRLEDMGYDVNVGSIRNNLSLSIFRQIMDLVRFLKDGSYDLVMIHQHRAAFVAMPASVIARVPVKIYFSAGLMTITPAERFFYRFGESVVIRLSDATMLNNLEDHDYVKKLRGCGGKGCFVSASEGAGIRTDVFNSGSRLALRPQVRRELSLQEDDIIVGFIGRCLWKKGMGDFIRAAHILRAMGLVKRIRYLVVGAGSDLDGIKREVSRLGLDRDFTFTGYRADVRRYFSALDIFVHPSYWEGLPTTLLQAMAMGIPSIATNIRGSRELIEHDRSGLIIGVRSPREIAEAVSGLVKDPVRAGALARRAETRIRESYSEDVLLPRTIEIISDVVNKRLFRSRRPSGIQR